MPGYSNPAYLESLSEFGKPVWLAGSGAGVLVQAVRATGHVDVRGPYPLFSCRNWQALPGELMAQLPEAVSFVGVVDPFQAPGKEVLQALFPDHCVGYKHHYVVDLEQPYDGPLSSGHRRNLTRGLRAIHPEELEDPVDHLDDWWTLYEGLNQAKNVQGIAAFSRKSFELQLALPEMKAYRALKMGRTVAMCLWLIDEDRAYYHLGASNEEGYGCGAMFALFDTALRAFQQTGIQKALLGAGAGVWGDASDGLSRFKSGWANEARTAYLCGKILNRAVYDELSRDMPVGFFPAYRHPQQAMASTSPSTI